MQISPSLLSNRYQTCITISLKLWFQVERGVEGNRKRWPLLVVSLETVGQMVIFVQDDNVWFKESDWKIKLYADEILSRSKIWMPLNCRSLDRPVELLIVWLNDVACLGFVGEKYFFLQTAWVTVQTLNFMGLHTRRPLWIQATGLQM